MEETTPDLVYTETAKEPASAAAIWEETFLAILYVRTTLAVALVFACCCRAQHGFCFSTHSRQWAQRRHAHEAESFPIHASPVPSCPHDRAKLRLECEIVSLAHSGWMLPWTGWTVQAGQKVQHRWWVVHTGMHVSRPWEQLDPALIDMTCCPCCL
jgi:hypothetical protein